MHYTLDAYEEQSKRIEDKESESIQRKLKKKLNE